MIELGRPLPTLTLDTKEFWEGCRHHSLLIQKCHSCGALRHYPRPMCPKCNSMDYEWVKAGGKGKIYSWIVAVHQVHPALKTPYIIAIVELEEGVRMNTNIVDCQPEELSLGMPVEVVFDDITQEVTLPKFRRVSAPD